MKCPSCGERKLVRDTRDEAGIDNGGVHLLVELEHRRADPFRFRRGQDALPAGRTELAPTAGIVVVSPL